MLIELRIENFAIAERLSVRLDAGLNVLTGETGAGKSIIVGALSLLLGERASAESVRAGAQKAVIEGVFDVAQRRPVLSLLAEQGIETEEGLLILRREIASSGRSRAWVNGAASTASLLSNLGRMLVDLHGQHEHQTLLRSDEQRVLLDEYSSAGRLAAKVSDAHARWRAALAELDALAARRREAEQRADYLRFQVTEIEKATPRIGEDEELETESRRLEHAEELARISEKFHQELYASDRSMTVRLDELKRQLEQLVRIDPTQADARELLETAYYAIEELGRRMGDYAAGVEQDPRRLAEVQQRLDTLYRLTSKYGPAIEDVLATAEKARAELALVDESDAARIELEQKRDTARAELEKAADELSKLRAAGARKLAKDVEKILPELGMSGGRFRIELERLPDIGNHGRETVVFLISLNAGFEPRELARVASGGELSRVMLALKTVLAGVDDVPTLVFDEIDSGIGGKVGLQVAEKLRRVGEKHQVFAITHLPQIASRAHHHLLVEKIEREGTTLTRVTPLSADDRVKELARMLGGDPESETSLSHAKELLAAGRA